MKKLLQVLLISLFSYFLVLGAGSAKAWDEGLQEILDNITINGNSSVNVNTDRIPDELDSYWYIIGSNNKAIATLIVTVEYAGFRHQTEFGIYHGSNRVPLLEGPDSPGDKSYLQIMGDGSVWVNNYDTGVNFPANLFGFYFDTPPQKNCQDCIFYSDTGLNPDGFDHIAAFQGKGDTIKIATNDPINWTSKKFVLGFEDLYGGGDGDHNDMVVFVESVYPALAPAPPYVQPVPEPSTLFLLGSGLVGLAFARKRMKK